MKNNQEYNAEIHGMKFNSGDYSDYWRWGYPNAWLYDLDSKQYYLCEFFTPWPWSDFWPWIIKKKPHKIWKVDESVVNKPCFQNLSPSERKKQDKTISKSYYSSLFIIVPGGGAFYAFLKAFPNNYFSTTNKLSMMNNNILQIVTCLLLCLILFITIKLVKYIFWIVARNGVQGKENMFQVMDKVKSSTKPQSIYITKYHIQIFKTVIKYILISLGIFILVRFLTYYPSSRSSAESVNDGIADFLLLISMIVMPLLMKPIDPEHNSAFKVKFRNE